MEHGGELELEFSNDDLVTHAAFVPSDGDRQTVILPVHQAGRVRVMLNQPGLYWFGCRPAVYRNKTLALGDWCWDGNRRPTRPPTTLPPGGAGSPSSASSPQIRVGGGDGA
jgi:hypothetical protein